ncbi:cupin domain-containing protein [Coraliomargarita parva]|uniref:cupin domain-containing protein n=1 Tax=Coraliomargarita parva TaxID=3014050 RepID=UPI0022B5BE8D|nr:cupin domain-containing protein [Coraliomargarita parva]
MTTHSDFVREGACILRNLYSDEELSTIRSILDSHPPGSPILWSKELAACSRNILNFATHPRLVRQLEVLLGPNILLWGACHLERIPGQVHPWHTDIESSRPEGGFVTVWIGLEGTNQASALKLVPGSHRYGKCLQERIQAHASTRDGVSDADVEAWAKLSDPDASGLKQPDIGNGDAIFFDGRLWHGSANTNADVTRRAFLFQYCAADVPVRIPDYRQLSWPFEFLDQPWPPCIRVKGEADSGTNRIAELPPQLGPDLSLVPTSVHPIHLDSVPETGERMVQQHCFSGKSPNLQRIGAHASSLAPGECPHAPHSHVDEEVLLVLRGSAELRYEDRQTGEIYSDPASAGDFVYYPAFHRHTIFNAGTDALVYLMFKWVAPSSGKSRKALALQRFHTSHIDVPEPSKRGFANAECLTGSTHHLKRFHAHMSEVQPGGGYAAHVDTHDVAIIVLEGAVTILGQKVPAGAFAWCAAGEPHDLANPDTEAARYLVLEFHGLKSAGETAVYRKPKRRKKKSVFKKRSAGRVLENLKRLFTPRSES